MSNIQEDQDLLKIVNLEKRMRNPDVPFQDAPLNFPLFPHKIQKMPELENSNENLQNNQSFSLFIKEAASNENLNEMDKENEAPNNAKEEDEEEKNEFSLLNYMAIEKDERKMKKSSETKRKSAEISSYYPIFKKLKTPDEISHKIFVDEKNGYSENSNDAFHMNSIKNNRKITEYFKKQKNQKNFVQNLIKNDALKTLMKEENNIFKNCTKTSLLKNNREILLKNVSLRKISFGDSNSNTDLFIDNSCKEKKKNHEEKKEKEKIKIVKLNSNNSSEKASNEKLKDEIRKLNKKLMDKDTVLKSEEAHLRHMINENKILTDKINIYEKQIVIFLKNSSFIMSKLKRTKHKKIKN